MSSSKAASTKTIAMDRVKADGSVERVYGKITDVQLEPSLTFLNTIRDFTATVRQGAFSEQIMRQNILLSNKLYLLGGICSSVVDIMVTMSNTIMEIETDNEEINDIMRWLQFFINQNNPKTIMGSRQLHEEYFMDLLLNGNGFPYEKWESIKVMSKGEWFLPMQIMNLNPMAVSIKATKDNMGEMIYYRNGSYSYVGSPDINKSSQGWQQIKSTNMQRITRRGRQYYWWGIPFLTKAFNVIAIKERLRQLDEVTTQGLISLITLFSLYDAKSGANAPQDVVSQFAGMLDGKPGQARYLTWGGPVDVKVVGPSNEILKFVEKYHEADKDIAEALACPAFLLTGSMQGNTAGADYSVKPFKTNLEDLQNIVGDWWKYITYKIAAWNNKKVNFVDVRWAAVNLDNDAVLISKVNNAKDRGLMSATSSALKLGVSSRLEEALIQKEFEKSQKDPNYMFGKPPAVPYQGEAGLAPGQNSASTKNGGDGRPKAEQPKKATDPVKQTKEAQKRRITAKDNAIELANYLTGSLISIIEDQTKEQDEKLEATIMTGAQIANCFYNQVLDELENPKEFMKFAFAESNNFSKDIQYMIVAGEVDSSKIQKETEKLAKRLYNKYIKSLHEETAE